jgi:hypothetical protein
MQLLANGKQQFIDQNGLPLANGSVYFYAPGTNNAKPTYQDPDGATLNTNPVALDSRGQAIIWGSGTYRQIVKDAAGNTIWDQLTCDANAGLTGNITDAKFSASTDFTPGVTTSLTLPVAPGSQSNLWVFFDAAFQADDQYTVSGTTVTFNSAIPVGVQEVNVKIGSMIAVGIPSTGSVGDSTIAKGSKIYNRINDVIDVKDYGAVGDGKTDDTTAVKTAISYANARGGATVFFPAGKYLISSPLVLTYPNVRLVGDSRYASTLTVPANATGFVGYNPNALVILNANYCGVRELGMDGNISNNSAQAFGAVASTVATTGIYVDDCLIQNFIYNGIITSPATGATDEFSFCRNTLKNIGWEGIAAYCSTNGRISGNKIISCGSNGILTGYNSNVSNYTVSQYITIEGNFVYRGTAPTSIVGGAAQNGFMIVVGAGDQYISVIGNVCYDNRAAAQDGIGLGQDGTRGNAGLVFDSNVVVYAGLFGIDVSSNHIVSNNYIRYSAQQGIKLGTDMGGNLVNATVVNNIVDSCNLAGTGSVDGIWVDGTLTAAKPTAIYSNIKINGNRVVDFNSPANTVYGLNISFKDNLTYSNNEFNDNDFTQLAGVNGSALHITGPSLNYVGWSYRRNRHPTPIPVIGGTTPNVMGLDACAINNGAGTTVSNFIGGFEGQELVVQSANGNTTYGHGSGILNNGSTAQLAAASSIWKFFRYSGNWMSNKFFTP